MTMTIDIPTAPQQPGPEVSLPRHDNLGATAPSTVIHPPPASPPMYCALLALDIAEFGKRSDDVQAYLRRILYNLFLDACNAANLPLAQCIIEDRGDGILLITRPCVDPEILLDPLRAHLEAALRNHRRMASPQAQIQLRVAIHAGHIRPDRHGESGRALNHLYRMLDSPQVRQALNAAGTDLIVATSSHLYDEIIQNQPGLLDPATWKPVAINVKETQAVIWIWLPPTPARSW